MRPLRREVVSVLSVLAVPAAVVFFFPFEALTFGAASAPEGCPASAAFVTLTPEQETAALIAARTSWQSDATERRHARLPLGELPAKAGGPLFAESACLLPPDVSDPLDYRPGAWKPSQGAERPVRLERNPETPSAPAFPREELLKMN